MRERKVSEDVFQAFGFLVMFKENSPIGEPLGEVLFA
jgi:hypothetical protein